MKRPSGGNVPVPRVALVAALVLVLAVAVWLRCRGLAFGLPAVYNMDEQAIMNRSLSFATGTLNPHNFVYPSLYFYLLFAWIGAFFGGGFVVGAFDSLREFERSYFVDPSGIFLAGRALSVVCGVATVSVVYALGRRLAGTTAGLAAALLLAVAPLAVRDAHYVKHDIPVTLLVAVVHLLVAATADSRSRLPLGAAAAISGLAASMHYYAVFLAVPVGLAALWGSGDPRQRLRNVCLCALLMTATFLAGSPYLLLDLDTALRDMAANRAIVVDRAGAHGGAMAGLGVYLDLLWRDAPGWPVLAAATGGVFVLARSAPRQLLLLVAFPAVFFFFIVNTVPASRYLNPLLPASTVLAGIGIAELSQAMAAARHRLVPVAALAVSGLIAVPGIRDSLAIGAFFRQDDTRTLAARYIEARVPPGSTVLLQPYSVPLRVSREGLEEALAHRLNGRPVPPRFSRQLALDPYPAPAYRLLWLGDGGLDVDKIYISYGALPAESPLRPLREAGVNIVIFKRYNDEAGPALRIGAALEREARLLTRFSPFVPGTSEAVQARVEPYLHNVNARLHPALERPGPVIEVWQLDATRIQ